MLRRLGGGRRLPRAQAQFLQVFFVDGSLNSGPILGTPMKSSGRGLGVRVSILGTPMKYSGRGLGVRVF